LKRKRRARLIVLSGIWKFGRKLDLTFESDYGNGKVRKIKFIAKIKATKKNNIIFSLYDKYNYPLGMSITFKRDVLPKKNFGYFISLKKEGRNPSVQLGGKIQF